MVDALPKLSMGGICSLYTPMQSGESSPVIHVASAVSGLIAVLRSSSNDGGTRWEMTCRRLDVVLVVGAISSSDCCRPNEELSSLSSENISISPEDDLVARRWVTARRLFK